MVKKRRNAVDKLKTLLFGKDLRVTEGDVYSQVREYDFSSYYPEEKYITDQQLPKGKIFDVRDFGADVHKNNNADAINRAVDEASKVGGIVLVSGGDYISATIVLKSNVTLFIEKGCAICVNSAGEGYDKYSALIYAENAENIIFTGGGKIKGSGNFFGRKPVALQNNTTPPAYIDVIEMRKDYRAQLRFAHPNKFGGPIVLKNCKNIMVDNFIVENSAYWTFKLVNCDTVNIKNFIINNNRNVANADGIDIAGSSNIHICHSFISTADDGIVLKNALWLGNTGAMHNVEITDCEIISRTNAIKIGTETTYDISGISIRDCRLFMTDLYPGSVSGISIESCDGSVLSDVIIKNISMDRCTCPIFIRLGNRNRASLVNEQSANAIEFGKSPKDGGSAAKNVFDFKGAIKDIVIENVTATGVEIPIIVAGYRQKGRTKYVENIVLKNIDLTYADMPESIDRRIFIPEYAKEYPECWRFRNLPAYALWSRHTKNMTTENFTCRHPQRTWKKENVIIDAK